MSRSASRAAQPERDRCKTVARTDGAAGLSLGRRALKVCSGVHADAPWRAALVSHARGGSMDPGGRSVEVSRECRRLPPAEELNVRV